jgi:hypothetical protein
MARNHTQTNKKDPEGNPDESESNQSDDATGPNATPGIEVNTTLPDDKYKHTALVQAKTGSVQRRQYQVENAKDVAVLYNGYHSTIQAGRIIDDVAYDIDLLRRQGVKLKEVTAETPAEI